MKLLYVALATIVVTINACTTTAPKVQNTAPPIRKTVDIHALRASLSTTNDCIDCTIQDQIIDYKDTTIKHYQIANFILIGALCFIGIKYIKR